MSFFRKIPSLLNNFDIINGPDAPDLDIRELDKVTRINVHKCLTMLAFEKDKMQLENDIMKRARR